MTGKSFWRNEPPFHQQRDGELVVRTGEGLEVTFSGIALGEAISRELH